MFTLCLQNQIFFFFYIIYNDNKHLFRILEKFASIPIPRQINSDDILLHYRHLKNDVIEEFPQLKVRIQKVIIIKYIE